MLKKYGPLALASLIGIDAFALPAASVSAGAIPYVQQNAANAADNILKQDVKHDRKWKKGHDWKHRRHGHRHHHHGFGHNHNFGFGIFPPFFLGGGYGYYDDGWCVNRRGRVYWCGY
ncbi:MAG: hypothetical protein ACREDX_06090 [Aestuariivirga sp.]